MKAIRVDCILKNTHVPVMFWRSIGSSQNAFAVESFIDELAEAAGQDPYRYRRKLLAGKADFLAVLDALAEKSDWDKPLPKGWGRGIAIHESFGTIVGEVVEVEVGADGAVKIHRVVAAVDCGHVVNPLTVAMQIESAVVYGLSAALFGEITIEKGAVVQGNFDDYQVARLADTPKIETHLVLSGGEKWGGHRRARHAADRAGAVQCDLCRHRQTHPQPADQEHRSEQRAGLSPAQVKFELSVLS